MNIIFLLFALIFAVILIALISNVRFRVEAITQRDDNTIIIDVYLLFGLVHINKKLPSPPGQQKKEDNKGSNGFNDTSDMLADEKKGADMKKVILNNRKLLLERMGSMFHIIIQTVKHIKVKQLTWQSRIGTGDAAETGVLTGIAWSIKSTLVGYVTSYVRLRTVPKLDIQPMFHEMIMESRFVIDAKLRVWHGVIAALKMSVVAWKNRKIIGRILQQQSHSA